MWIGVEHKKSSAGGLGSLLCFFTVFLSDFEETISLFVTVSPAKTCGPWQHNILPGLFCLRQSPSEIAARVGTYVYHFSLAVLKAS